MSVYADANVLVAFFAIDALSQRAISYLANQAPALVISNFAAAEFASAISRRVRMGELSRDEAIRAFSNFDAWVAREATMIDMEPADVRTAGTFLRRLDFNLRTPDALHIAIAQRVGAELATFDERMAANARALGTGLAAL